LPCDGYPAVRTQQTGVQYRRIQYTYSLLTTHQHGTGRVLELIVDAGN
jgi:hypothetical protein